MLLDATQLGYVTCMTGVLVGMSYLASTTLGVFLDQAVRYAIYKLRHRQ